MLINSNLDRLEFKEAKKRASQMDIEDSNLDRLEFKVDFERPFSVTNANSNLDRLEFKDLYPMRRAYRCVLFESRQTGI